MNIGITYDLRENYIKQGFSKEETAELDSIETIKAIESAIIKAGHNVDKIGGIKNLVSSLSQGKRWDLVFNICEGMYGSGRESQVPALLDAYEIPYVFSDTVVLGITLHKGFAKNIIRDNNISTADFKIVSEVKDIENIGIEFPMFVKPVAEGTGKGITGKSIVNNLEQLEERCKHLIEKFNQPVLVEKFLSGREFTVGILGTGDKSKVIGVMEIVVSDEKNNEIYSYDNKLNYEDTVSYYMLDDITAKMCEDVALKAWKVLNCRDGGRVDLKMDEKNTPNFLEINPLAGLHPVHSDLPIMAAKVGIDYDRLVQSILSSAIQRISGE